MWHMKQNVITWKQEPHCVEIPSMVDSQWNMLHWRSKCKFHTVCWSADDCALRTTSVYFGITIALSLEYYLSLPWGPSTNIDFSFMSKISFEGLIRNLMKIPCTFKTWMEFVWQILIQLETYFIRGFHQLFFDVLLGVTYANMLVATQWPLKGAPDLPGSVWYGGLEVHLS